MAKNAIIIGLAGTFASGKDTLAEYLVEKHHFMHVSTGDIVRDEAARKYGSTDRSILKKMAFEMRSSSGASVLVEQAIARYDQQADKFPGGLVASGIRSMGEADAIKNSGGIIVFVDAPIELRYQRASARNRRDLADKSFAEFQRSEANELNESRSDPTKFNILGIKEMADILLLNDSDLEAFLFQAETKLDLI